MFFRMVYKSGQVFFPFCHNSRVWQTDGQTDRRTDGRTDRILIARPRLHYMQRGKNLTPWAQATWTKTMINVNYLQEFVHKRKVFKMSTIGTDTCLKTFLHCSIAVSIISCRKSDQNCSLHVQMTSVVNIDAGTRWRTRSHNSCSLTGGRNRRYS